MLVGKEEEEPLQRNQRKQNENLKTDLAFFIREDLFVGNPSFKGQMWRESQGISRVPWSLMWTDMEIHVHK